jgi:hypothetical protein
MAHDQSSNVSLKPQHRNMLPELAWDDINEPGAYVEIGAGDLYRIPQEALVRGSSPMIRKQSVGASRFLKLTGDIAITTFEARMLCAENNVKPNF